MKAFRLSATGLEAPAQDIRNMAVTQAQDIPAAAETQVQDMPASQVKRPQRHSKSTQSPTFLRDAGEFSSIRTRIPCRNITFTALI